MEISVHPPSPLLAPYVKHYWFLEGSHPGLEERILPTGMMELVIHYGDPFLTKYGQVFLPQAPMAVSGLSSRWSTVQTSGETRMAAATFRPLGAGAFFSFSMDELTNQTYSMESLGIRGSQRWREKLVEARNSRERASILDEFLLGLLQGNSRLPPAALSSGINGILKAGGNVSVAKLSSELEVSEKTLERLFKKWVGLTPKTYLRILRFQRVLHLAKGERSLRQTDLAYKAGFTDQAHFIREFQALSGDTPGHFLCHHQGHSDLYG